MEPASAVRRLRARGFERECERLRPLGEAYLLRHFAGQLSRADAEDAVAEVLIRLHREAQAGRPPQNLRAMFFTSVRNAAIDLLRARAARPSTVALEALAEAPAAGAPPAELAESGEDAVRLQEALARMRGGYRETILLRFGLGLTVPEIADHFEISVAAAKKRVLRASAQARKRMAAIEAEEFCPQMRQLARDSAFDRQASGLASEAEAEALRAHFSHCGACRSYLAQLRDELHELGGALLGALGVGQRLSGKLDILHHLGQLGGNAVGAAQGAIEKLRQFALRASGPFNSGDGAAGAALGTGQKIAAVCGAGAAATATCLIGGAVGPGIGPGTHASHARHRPAPKVEPLRSARAPAFPSLPGAAASGPSGEAAAQQGASQTSSPSQNGSRSARARPRTSSSRRSEPLREASTSASPPTEFGIEGGSSPSGSGGGSGSAVSPSEAPSASARPSGGGTGEGFDAGGSGSGSSPPAGGGSGSSSSAGGGSVGFQG